jgi:hypothetical protein
MSDYFMNFCNLKNFFENVPRFLMDNEGIILELETNRRLGMQGPILYNYYGRNLRIFVIS